MHTHSNIFRCAIMFVFLVTMTLEAAPPALAQAESVLYNFCSLADCADGLHPRSTPVVDSGGNLYGTTSTAGGADGAGVVFKVSSDGNETVLHIFSNSNGDGRFPDAGLVRDRDGNLYGTTYAGGAFNSGTVFKLSPDGTETILYNFAISASDGGDPEGALVRDAQGNLYGTTVYGGAYNVGTVFEVSPTGVESILHSFAPNTQDGVYPEAGLIFDQHGNLCGTTTAGGGTNGYGTVFRISPNGTETILHTFGNKSDGRTPQGGLVLGKNGELYGTTSGGGAFRYGTVFKLSPNGAEWVLHSFSAKNGDGTLPMAELVLDANGDVYGTTTRGGSSGAGAVFELTPNGTETILHSFSGLSTDGAFPQSGLVMDSMGNLYGTTLDGGTTSASGTLYKITP